MTAPKPATPTTRTCATCGHVGRYGTLAQADYHFARHSCALVVERRARVERRLSRLVESGPERPCTCKTVHHQHGTIQRYQIDGCHCLPCKAAKRHTERKRRRDVLYGLKRQVDAQPAREHVLALRAQGMGNRRIAEVAGVTPSVISKLMYGRTSTDPHQVRPPTKKLERGTAAKILAVEVDLAAGARVDSPGTARRVQALVALGWSQAKLAAHLDMPPSHLTGLIHGRRSPTRSTADRVRSLYDQLWNRIPARATRHDQTSYTKARAYAAAHGWVSPLAWDDDTIDDPAARPDLGDAHREPGCVDHALVERALTGEYVPRPTPAERVEIGRRWLASGRSNVELNRIQGWNIQRDRRREAAA